MQEFSFLSSFQVILKLQVELEKLKGWGFEAPEEATMAGQPFQEHLKGSDVQDLLCHGEAPGLVS